MERIKGYFACRRVRKALLRAESGEVSPGELARTREHLAGCAKCREIETFLHSVSGAWGQFGVFEPGPDRKDRTLRAALQPGGGQQTGRESRVPRGFLRWGPVTAGVAVCLLAAVLLRGGGGPGTMNEPVPAESLEWSNGVEEALARISGQTAALWSGMLPPEPALDPVGEGLARVENAVAELRLSREEAWSYQFERRLHGLSRETADLSAALESL